MIKSDQRNGYGSWSGVYNGSGSYPVYKMYMEKTDTARRIKPADLFYNSTPRSYSHRTTHFNQGTLVEGTAPRTTVYNCPYSYWQGSVVSYNSTLPIPVAADFDSLDRKARLRIKEQTVNLAVMFAEAGQTYGLIRNLATDVYKTFHSFRSGRPIKDFISNLAHPKTRNGRRLASRWLEYQYGLKPLLSDIHGSTEAIIKGLQNGGRWRYVRVRSDETARFTSYPTSLLTDTVLVTRAMTVKVRYDISAPGLKLLSEIGVINPAIVAWELVPWSFVIDWALPVGDYLSSFDALVGVSWVRVRRGYYRTESTISALNRNGKWLPPPTATYLRTDSGRLSPSDGLPIRPPRFKSPLSRDHMLNALALLRQLKS